MKLVMNGLVGVIALALLSAGPARALDKVTFGTNWLAEAEHGGYYQAVVDGTYAHYGLDVTILQGGPQANNRLLLVTGKIDFYMGANMLPAFDAVSENIPSIVVAGHFQKDPEIFMSHPGEGLDQWQDLEKAPSIFVSKEGLATIYQWMKTEYGFKEENVKPYNFNSAPFIADKKSVQQGYVTSEPYAIQTQAHFAPNVFLAADYGWDTYSTVIETRRDLVASKPNLVQRFIDASAIGWYHYLYGDNRAANAAIKKDNPDITDAQLAYSTDKMKEYGIVDSGDTLQGGIGAMTDARMQSFFQKMVSAGVAKADLDYKKAYTLQFVDKGVGTDLRPKN
ncbi:MAG TPA: ABC transporter substrate-binding protein [Beijerinckiaceae bacterium]|jgi:NitT/TauT family transport system substrate-binding protein|nr:ABC transporter substrate-binding protein [Beijerinckiaceae bacterium]